MKRQNQCGLKNEKCVRETTFAFPSPSDEERVQIGQPVFNGGVQSETAGHVWPPTTQNYSFPKWKRLIEVFFFSVCILFRKYFFFAFVHKNSSV